MLGQETQAAAPADAGKQKFLDSVYGVLCELQKLLLAATEPISPDTGAQIAQMLRAIREGASTHELDHIAHTTINIEMYLISGEPYGPNGALRNVVLRSRVQELLQQVADAMVDRPPGQQGHHMVSPPTARMDRPSA